MKRIVFSLALASVSAPALAVTPVPGQWDTAQQPIAYPVIGSNEVYAEQLGDGSNAHGGLPPAFAWQLADIPAPVIDTRQITEGAGSGSITGNDEAKFRFTLFTSHVLPDDPLRNHCSRGASHLHEFMGADRAGACTTFGQLRTDANTDFAAGKRATTNPGKNLNASSYWRAALIDPNPLGDGIDRIKKSLLDPLYYQVNGDICAGVNSCILTKSLTYVDFPMGFGYVNGKNMDDPWNLRITTAVTAANAANLAAGGNGTEYSSLGDGFVGWECTAPGGTVRDTFKDNIDDLTCLAGDTLIAEVDGTGCWDGHNTYSPSGYDHVIPAISVTAKDTVGGATVNHTDVCPVHWFKIPQLIDKPQFILTRGISAAVPNDSPYLSSDAQFQAKARTFAGHSTFVCKAGCSFHFDYLQAWQKKYIRRAFRHCLGIPWTDPSETGALDADQVTRTVNTCNSDTLSKDTGTESALTQLPFVPTTDVDGHDIHTFYPTPVPKGHMGAGTMHP